MFGVPFSMHSTLCFNAWQEGQAKPLSAKSQRDLQESLERLGIAGAVPFGCWGTFGAMWTRLPGHGLMLWPPLMFQVRMLTSILIIMMELWNSLRGRKLSWTFLGCPSRKSLGCRLYSCIVFAILSSPQLCLGKLWYEIRYGIVYSSTLALLCLRYSEIVMWCGMTWLAITWLEMNWEIWNIYMNDWSMMTQWLNDMWTSLWHWKWPLALSTQYINRIG